MAPESRQQLARPASAALFLCTLCLLVAAVPARGIVNGQADGNGHPNVGIFVLPDPSGSGFDPGCSGTLVAPRVFLTAAHCLAFLPPQPLAVTFDPSWQAGETPDSLFTVASFAFDPDFRFVRSDMHDVGVLLLDETPPITPAHLPTARLLDQLAKRGALVGRRFDTVGYGITGFRTGGGRPEPLFPEDGVVTRRVTSALFSALAPTMLYTLSNTSLGSGGSCIGDSGAPHFLTVNGTPVNVADTTGGDPLCRTKNFSYRLDTPSARDFLGDYVTLP